MKDHCTYLEGPLLFFNSLDSVTGKRALLLLLGRARPQQITMFFFFLFFLFATKSQTLPYYTQQHRV